MRRVLLACVLFGLRVPLDDSAGHQSASGRKLPFVDRDIRSWYQKMPEAEWNDENTRIICELFAEQVRAGNRPNTHLNNIGYREVASKFERRTRLLYTKRQLKNKWDKLKSDYINWKKLLARGAGLGWNNARGTIAADNDWWKSTFKELPGAKKFRKAGIQNEDHLKVMFEDITSNGVDHSSLAACSLASALDSTVNVENIDGLDNIVEDNDGTQLNNNDDTQLDHNVIAQLDHESPSIRNKKRTIHVNAKENKKNKAETALLMQAQLKRIAELAEEAQFIFEKFSSQADSPGSDIQDVMALVRECGAWSGSDEYFIATELFVNRDQREMFLTMETVEERLEWLRRKYNAKYRRNNAQSDTSDDEDEDIKQMVLNQHKISAKLRRKLCTYKHPFCGAMSNATSKAGRSRTAAPPDPDTGNQ